MALRLSLFQQLILICCLIGTLYTLLTRLPIYLKPMNEKIFHVAYSVVPGFFLQDDPKTDPTTFDFMTSNFGLIDQSYDTDGTVPSTSTEPTSWERFAHKLSMMNKQSHSETSYKLLFLGRHGQGYHNVAEQYYGTKAWDCYYSALPGNGTITWLDAALTPHGIEQANNLSRFWFDQIAIQHIPTPQLYISSPLSRAIHTAQLTFSPLIPQLPSSHPFLVQIKENLRECIGIHTCDLRSPRSSIAAHFPPPTFQIEDGFSEDDLLWHPDLRESPSAQTFRLRGLLDDLFTNSTAQSREVEYLSLTTHGGSITSILRAVGHREFSVPVGGCIPVLIQLKKIPGPRPPEEVQPWLPREDCGEEHYDNMDGDLHTKI